MINFTVSLILSKVENRYALKRNTPRLSSYLINWNISDASLGTEELAHMEMVNAIMYQLTRNLTPEEIKQSSFASYFMDHTTGVYPVDASGVPFDAMQFASTGDPIADLNEDMAAEQKARLTYDNILRLADDPDLRQPIKYLRAREIVHYQRFGEGKRRGCSMADKLSTGLFDFCDTFRHKSH